ncbi:MAG: hypothetical protein RSA19_00405 [Cetobacterium sp.]
MIVIGNISHSQISEKAMDKLRDRAQRQYDSYSSQQNYIESEIKAYNKLEKLGEELSPEEYDYFLKRVESMYPYNYSMQLKKMREEIKFSKELQNRVVVKVDKLAVPKEIVERFKAEGERLYPKNTAEQKRYFDSSIENYKFIINFLKKNK